MLTRRPAALLAAAIALAACQKAETPEQAHTRMQAESQAARPAIEAADASYSRFFNAGQADSIAALHASDTHVMPANGPAMHGRDGVRTMLAGYFQQAPGSRLALRTEDVTANGPMAVDRGRFVFTPPAGSPMPVDSGKYLEVFWKVDGAWLIHDDIWNSDVPLPPPPPAARRH